MLKIARNKDEYMVELFRVDCLNTLFSKLVEEQLLELLGDGSGLPVVFNLQAIRFIDSEGFDTLFRVADRALEKGREFKLCNVSEDVHELIILMELEGRFSFCNYEDTREKILVALD